MQAVARQLIRRDIVAKIPSSGALDQQVSDEGVQLLLRAADVLSTMEQGYELLVMALVRNERVHLEHSLQALAGIARFVTNTGEYFQMPTPLRVMRESLAAITNQPDASGPATPAYVADRPQTLTFEKPDPSSPGIRHRHHTRVWQTDYCADPGCRQVWVATASFDVGIELSSQLHLPTHRIDPHIDTERGLISSDLARAGARERGTIGVVPPLKGTNAAGDAFTTDGRAVILILPAM